MPLPNDERVPIATDQGLDGQVYLLKSPAAFSDCSSPAWLKQA